MCHKQFEKLFFIFQSVGRVFLLIIYQSSSLSQPLPGGLPRFQGVAVQLLFMSSSKRRVIVKNEKTSPWRKTTMRKLLNIKVNVSWNGSWIANTINHTMLVKQIVCLLIVTSDSSRKESYSSSNDMAAAMRSDTRVCKCCQNGNIAWRAMREFLTFKYGQSAFSVEWIGQWNSIL